jgi:hypothetical protein
MYKFYNWLFRWDYVHWTCVRGREGISKVYVSGEGEPYITISDTNIIKVDKNTKLIWLTCKREKYLGEELK